MTQPQVRPNEAELIKSVCAGEREAFYKLVRPYERMIYATAISVVKNAADAAFFSVLERYPISRESCAASNAPPAECRKIQSG